MQHQNLLPRETWSMHGWSLSNCGLAKPQLTQPSVVPLERKMSRSNELSAALLPVGQGLTSPPAPSPTVSQQGQRGRLGVTARFSQESSQVCSGEADPRSSWEDSLQVRVQVGRDMTGDQHSSSTAQAGDEGLRLSLKWGSRAMGRVGGGPRWGWAGPGG